jgi:hypothetical protein
VWRDRQRRDRLKHFVTIVDHDRINNDSLIKRLGGLANEDQSSDGRSALNMYRQVPWKY